MSTWRLHEFAPSKNLQMLTGSSRGWGQTHEDSTHISGGRFGAYAGGLYAHNMEDRTSVARVGPYSDTLRWPGPGGAHRLRLASTESFQPPYTYLGNIFIHSKRAEEDTAPASGITFQVVHINNDNNIAIRFGSINDLILGTGVLMREIDNKNKALMRFEMPTPTIEYGVWHRWVFKVWPSGRIQFWWNRELCFDYQHDDFIPFLDGGPVPVGLRLDEFDLSLDDTRVWRKNGDPEVEPPYTKYIHKRPVVDSSNSEPALTDSDITIGLQGGRLTLFDKGQPTSFVSLEDLR